VIRRIAFAVPGDLSTPTGGYTYDRRIIGELRRLGFGVDVIDLGEGFPRPSAETRAAALAKLAAIPSGVPIVLDGLALGVLPEIAALIGRNPLLGLVHHPLALETGLAPGEVERLRASERAALASMRTIIVTSRAVARVLVADYGVSPDVLRIAPPGSEPVACGRGGGGGRSGGIVALLSVGIIVPRKGYDVLVAALATLRELPWRLTIVGDRRRDAQQAARLEADILRRGLTARIGLEGALPAEGLAELYAAADVFVLASRYEGYGMAFAQAIAYGLPVIGTTAGAIPETVPAGAGLLVAPDDVPALAAALRLLISDAGERARLAGNARAASNLLPSWAASAAVFARAIEEAQ
jgi:glycosyltransferase involved in cell wall biosynthesis